MHRGVWLTLRVLNWVVVCVWDDLVCEVIGQVQYVVRGLMSWELLLFG